VLGRLAWLLLAMVFVVYAGGVLTLWAPHKWIVGMEDLKGRHLYRPTKVRVRPSHDGVGLIPESQNPASTHPVIQLDQH
jgi:hypothetical protein